MKKFISLSLILFMLAGCSAVPTSGPINPGLDVQSRVGEANNIAIPQSPRAGMSAIEVVSGFLQANAGPIGDYAVARQYLIGFINFEWNPNFGIRVFESPLELQEISPGVVRATGILNLALDDQFRPIKYAESTKSSFEITLNKEAGEWRIVNPPSGIILTKSDFQQKYKLETIWFANKNLSRITPDFIAIGLRTEPATQLIRSMSNGSSDWLRPAVTNLLSEEFTGGISELQRINNLIRIDFDTAVLRLSIRQQQMLVSQLAQTLNPLPGIDFLEVRVGGQLLEVQGISNPLNLQSGNWLAQRSFDETTVYAISKLGELIRIPNDLIVSSWITQFDQISNLAITADEQSIAVSLPRSGELAIGKRGEAPRIISLVASASNLNFDSNDTLWFINQTNRNLFAYENDELIRANLNLPENARLEHAMVGPGNIRVAVATKTGVQSEIALHRLVKSDRGYQLKDPITLMTFIGDVVSLKWFTATQLVLMVKYPNQSEPVAVIVELSSGQQSIVRLPDSTINLDSNALGSLLAISDRGQIWLRDNANWRQIGVSQLATFSRK